MAAASASAELHQQVAAAPPAPPAPPQVHVKHGVSKCKECNIVFCRHENYLAHKRHYCQSRLQEEPPAPAAPPDCMPSPGAPGAAGATTGNSRSPSANSPPEPAVAPATPATQYMQYICAHCHIKYTSLDNLTHHQAYYCPKRPAQDGSVAIAVPSKVVEDKGRRRCHKCKASVPADQASSHHCDVVVVSQGQGQGHSQGGWRCPCCPVTSPTISAAQRHMETHQGIKAYRCTLCGYKGNTLRGMRTHIRMHFEKGVPDLQEETYISCVMEDDAAIPAPVPAPAPLSTPPTPPSCVVPLTAATDASSLPGAAGPESDHQLSCELCAYTTYHKINMLQHVKRAHSRSNEDAIPSTPLNSTHDSDDQRPHNTLNGADRVSIKEETQDEDFIAIENLKVKEEPLFISEVEERSSLSVRASPLIEDSKPSLKGTEGEETLSANNNKTGPKYCKSCDISFTLYDNFMTHKKFYCTRSEPDSKVAQASAL